jgi:hypothetical protein
LAYHSVTCGGVISFTGMFSNDGNSQSLRSWVYSVLVDGDSSRTRSQAAEYSPNRSGGCATTEPGATHSPRSMSTSIPLSHRLAAVLAVLLCPVGSTYRACHLPPGSCRTLPNRRPVMTTSGG